MSNISFDLSGKIDQKTVAVLSLIKRIADSLNIPFFVVGATARDIILNHCYGLKTPRMTKDIDLGVEVSGWKPFSQLRDSLLSTGKFSPTSEMHRLQFDSILIDIIPFGAITDDKKQISWPPEHEIFVNMVGFKEAYESSITVRLNSAPALDIRLPTLPGLALMKLISWKAGYPERQKDAEDLLVIMQKYEEAGNFDRLYGKERILLEEENFDTMYASIRLLGRDIALMAEPFTFGAVRAILDEETAQHSQFRLVTDMIGSKADFEAEFDEIFLLSTIQTTMIRTGHPI
jgi:predicted nucleotidyltransferase